MESINGRTTTLGTHAMVCFLVVLKKLPLAYLDERLPPKLRLLVDPDRRLYRQDRDHRPFDFNRNVNIESSIKMLNWSTDSPARNISS